MAAIIGALLGSSGPAPSAPPSPAAEESGAEEEVTPEQTYVDKVNFEILSLDEGRVAARQSLTSARTPAAQRRLSLRLAEQYGRALAAISALEPPSSVQPTHDAIVGATRGVRASYLALASAARAGDRRQQRRRSAEVEVREAELQRALNQLSRDF